MTHSATRISVLGTIAAVGLSAIGCVPLEEHAVDDDDLFAPLHEADLSGFEQNLAIQQHLGEDDAWTDVGRAIVDLANCRPISAPPPARVADHRRANAAYELVRLEEIRRQRLIHRHRELERPGWHTGTLHTRFTSQTFFDRSEPEPDPERIYWPDTGEQWPDELPSAIELDYLCGQLHAHAPPEFDPDVADDIELGDASIWLFAEWKLTDQLEELIGELDDGDPLVAHAHPRLTAHRADLAVEMFDREEFEEIETPRRAAAAALDALQLLANQSDESSHAVSLRRARLAELLEKPDVAIDAYEHLFDHPNERVAAVARYYAAKLSWEAGDWQRVTELSDGVVDAPVAIRSAHAYFVATAHHRLGEEDAFIATARQALRDRRRDADDPFMGALYRRVLRELATYDYDDRTEELLEEFGPRAELSVRRREFAEVALDMGRPDVAEQIVEPMFDHIYDARRTPRLRAIMALAAFLQDDRDAFERRLDELLQRREDLQEVIPRNRRAAFFAHRDAELARVLRSMLPMMAEWGDDEPARRLRQVWLEVIVERTQQFLRHAPDTAVSDDLVELYRLSGRLLEDHPRGYAERVGSDGEVDSALVLGTVEVPPSPPLEKAPVPRITWSPITSLLAIPEAELPPKRFAADVRPDSGDEEAP